MLTSNQIRIARFALRWSMQELSEKTDASMRTLRRIEATDSIPHSSAATVQSLQDCLEAAGIEFIGSPDDRPGILIGRQAG